MRTAIKVVVNYQIVDLRHKMTDQVRNEIIQFWLDEGALTHERAVARVDEVLQVIRSESDGVLMGICTATIAFVPEMQSHLYNYRSFVGKSYRSHGLVRHLCIDTFERLNQDFIAGRQTRAIGVYLDIESAHLQKITPAVWPTTKFVFVGVKPNGNHVRVRYFQGAEIKRDAPAPQP